MNASSCTRRGFLKGIGLGAALMTVPKLGVAAGRSARKPNILYIMSDDHAAHAISAYGSRLAKVAPTPNIDGLAKEGILLENVFCTNSICTPSRATILTGQYSQTNGVLDLGGSLEPENQHLPRLMKQAGVNFGILGEEEMCCGDPARRLGAEHIFQMLAMNNIQLFSGYNVKKIVTACPHCFNTLKNEYPQLGGSFEVVHHSQFIADLLKENLLSINHDKDAIMTYQDACYLGRCNDIYSPPRQILKSIPGVTLVEMEHNRQDGFCCGGGGGRMWLEETTGQRINEMRLGQALKTEGQVVATACPFCLQMLEDASRSRDADNPLEIKDIAEILAESCGTTPEAE